MSNKAATRGLFSRIFVLYALIMAVSVLFTELYITKTVRDSYLRELRSNLAVQGRLISSGVPFRPASPLDDFCGSLKQKTGSRVTVIAASGRVIGDSDSDSASMDNHAQRVEVRQAMLAGTGSAVRYSETLGYDFLYVAVRSGEGEGVVRLAMPLREIASAVNLLRIKILSVVLSILVAAGMFSVAQIERIRRLTRQIRDFAGALAAGQLGRKLFLQHKGEFDEIAGSLNTMSDELKSRIAEQEEEQQRLNMILRSIPDALFITDADGTITISSLTARKLFGETALREKPFIEVIRNAEFVALMETVRAEGKTASAEIRLDAPLAKHFVVQISPLFYQQGRLSGFIAIFHDITQLRRLEQTRKDFVANISHEIRTPITAIQGFADTLLDGALNDPGHAVKFLKTIKMNSERINNLVEDLMTISKLELGVIRVEKSDVDVQEVADYVVDALRDRAAAKALAVKTKPSQENRIIIAADRDRLIQILSNLADNAVKFTEKGEVTIGYGRENDSLYVAVEDTGIGIAAKHLARLGERFYRVDPGRSRNMGGTGLGLAIVKHLVKAHGWDMQIESSPGKGTKVRILINDRSPGPS